MDQREQVNIGTMTAEALGMRQIGSGQIMSISTPEQANRNIGVLDNALKTVNKQRADLGAYQNRMEMAIKGIDVAAENLQASESRIRDLDMAKESVEFHQEPDPLSGQQRYACSGQPEISVGSPAAAVVLRT